MARMPSTLGERRIPRATRRIASLDPSVGISATRRGAAAVGEGLDDIAKGLQVAEAALYEEQLRDEERAVKNLEVEWSKKRREILFGDGTPSKPGFFSTAGEDTLNARPGVEAELNKARSGILGKAKNTRIRQAFDLSSSSSLQGELEQVDRYTIGQRREANIATSKASIDEAIQQAATYFSDSGKWDAAVDRIASETAAMGDLQGWSQEVINNTTQQFISKAASDRVKRALLTDATSGEAAYTEMRNMIDGDMRIEIEQDIKAAKKAEEVEKRLAEAERRQALADLDKAAFGEWATKILSGEPVDTKALALDDRMDGQSKFALANALEAKVNKTPPKDYGLFNNLFARVHLPEGHPDKINDWKELNQYQAQLGDFTMFEQLRQEVEKVGTAEGKTTAALQEQSLNYARKTLTAAVDPMGIFKDPKGEALVHQATSEILKLWDKGLKEGKAPYELAEESQKIVDGLRRPMDVMFKDTFNSSTGQSLLAPDAATPGADLASIPVISTSAEYEKLPVGSQYRKPGDPASTIRTKK